MAADRFPSEFEDLLSREGRRVLAGTHALCGALALGFWNVPDEFDCGNSENTPAAPPWISRTVPVNSASGYASTVKLTRCPTCTASMSVSSTRAVT